MKQLYFMRHGLSVMNKQGIFSGRNDTPLEKEGIQQCKEAAQKIKGLEVDLIVSSPMKRAVDSARIVAAEIGYPQNKIVINQLFTERNFGVLEGTTYYHGMDLDERHGVEPTKDIVKRAKAGLEYLRGLDSDTVLLVSHGAVGRALEHVLNPSLGYHEVKSITNAEIVQLI